MNPGNKYVYVKAVSSSTQNFYMIHLRSRVRLLSNLIRLRYRFFFRLTNIRDISPENEISFLPFNIVQRYSNQKYAGLLVFFAK